MNKSELIELLKNYKENKAKLNIKLKELKTARIKLKYVNDTETSMTPSYGNNQDIHSKNQISDKVSKKIEENDTKRIELEREIEKLENEVRKLREKVEVIDDRMESLKDREKKVIIAYYVEGISAEQIGNKLYYELFNQTRTGRHIQRIVERATQKMLKL